MISLHDFLALSDVEIAQQVNRVGGRVCNFPLNGTRRWFHLEHVLPNSPNVMADYMDIAGQAHIDVFSMVFRHGVSTLLSPTFGVDIMQRDADYIHMAIIGMRRLVENPDFLDFYAKYDVRVRFYGEYRKYFAGTPFEPMCDLFDKLTERTSHHATNRLFWGICAHDTVQPIADLSIAFFQQHNRTPTREELIELYYGELVQPVDFFIGFDKFASYDMPMLTTGNEDLYFTVAPSLYITDKQFRRILYDHLYLRHTDDPDYSDLSFGEWQQMREFYLSNKSYTQGLGARHPNGHYWYPLSQVTHLEPSDG